MRSLNDGRRSFYLAVTVLLVVAAGVVFCMRAERIPYGDLAPGVLGACLIVASIPAALLGLAIRRTVLSSSRAVSIISPKDIPVKADRTFLGHGFNWTPELATLLKDSGLESDRRFNLEQNADLGNHLIHGVGAANATDLFLPNSALTQHLFVLVSEFDYEPTSSAGPLNVRF